MSRLPVSSELNKIAKAISSFMTSNSQSGWFKDIPISEIDTILRLMGFRLVNEDGTDLECLFCGREGRSILNIAPINDNEIIKYGLALSWYKTEAKKQYQYDIEFRIFG